MSAEALPTSAPAAPIPTLTIGEAVRRLQADFPDLSNTKLRYLEEEGLISPYRAKSGYRRFSPELVRRIHYILTLQEQGGMRLQKIREHLDQLDRGEVSAIGTASVLSTSSTTQRTPRRLNKEMLADYSGTDIATVSSLARHGIIAADHSGLFSSSDLAVVDIALKLRAAGVPYRALKQSVTMAQRQCDMAAQVAKPLSYDRSETAAERRREKEKEVAGLLTSLNTALMKSILG